MPNYDYNDNQSMRQKDLVLSTNEFVFVQNKTNGVIRTYTGPIMLTISQQEALVIFDNKTKQFKEITNFDNAKQLFCSAPENWYVVLKNPAPDNAHPEAGKAVSSPDLTIGKKINITGPCSFSLFPGQMTKVIQGHRLRSNQYLLARVYDAEAASKNSGTTIDAKGNEATTNEQYFSGQLLIIKGTDVSFYIPPTGIEVIPVDNNPQQGYVRDAITLERLEYTILKDENGTKEYVHGPKVVFPKPTETFVASPKGGYIFRAMELSPISGIYVKVIAAYDEKVGKDTVHHSVGEELFITGKDQMIYYPRPEHSIITYDGKSMHHAIAIPKGEGRYVMNRLTGEIKTVFGPSMYLPDPRTEVVVKRKLTPTQCKLWYPGNTEVLAYNDALTEKAVEKYNTRGLSATDALAYATLTSNSTLATYETNASIARGTSYTKPRTITLDTKYEGVVSLDVWTGFAVKVTSKSGKSRVVCGPQTILLDYDETLEVLNLSTGKPKATDRLDKTVFLRYENNKVSDYIDVETKDFVKASIKISYSVNFQKSDVEKWFNIDNYVKYLCDRERMIIKNAVKKYNIDEFYQNYMTIIHDAALDANRDMADGEEYGYYFPENGMRVHDCEVLDLYIAEDIQEMLEEHQKDMIEKSLRLADAERTAAADKRLAELEEATIALEAANRLYRLQVQTADKEARDKAESEANRRAEAEKAMKAQAEIDLEKLKNTIAEAERAREAAAAQMKLDFKKQADEMDKAKQQAYADVLAGVIATISPDLIAAMNSKTNADLLTAVSKSVAPYAIAEGESIADVTTKLLRGTTLESIAKDLGKNN